MKNLIALTMLVACAGPSESTTVASLNNGNCHMDGDGVCRCVGSPIIVDLGGNGFALSSPDEGVVFDLDGKFRLWAWTLPNTDDAWLVLDINADGYITSGAEMFGDHTIQVLGEEPNGFLALGLYDRVDQGGNADGVISVGDQVFSSLRLWTDSNHDGISDTEELFTLEHGGIQAFSLSYVPSALTDVNGNEFRYAAAVTADAPVGATVYDVFLQGRLLPTGSGGGDATTQNEPYCAPGESCWELTTTIGCRPIKAGSDNVTCNNGLGNWDTMDGGRREYHVWGQGRAYNNEVNECPSPSARLNELCETCTLARQRAATAVEAIVLLSFDHNDGSQCVCMVGPFGVTRFPGRNYGRPSQWRYIYTPPPGGGGGGGGC